MRSKSTRNEFKLVENLAKTETFKWELRFDIKLCNKEEEIFSSLIDFIQLLAFSY